MRTRISIRTAAAVLGLLVPGALAAQAANPLPQASAMGDSYTALARGLGAPAWNPAGLGMPDNPGLSFTLAPIHATMGLEPVSPADLAEFEGELIPRETRLEWLEAITDAGGEEGTIGLDATALALSIGRVAVSASGSFRARASVAPDVAEVLFFGNAGLTGDPGSYDLEGSSFDAAGTTTIAASTAIPVPLTLGPLPDQHFAVGVTIKYIMGRFLALGQESESSIGSDPVSVDVRFPLVHTPFPEDSLEDRSWQDVLDNGSGIGIDVGAAWQGGIFSAGVVIKDLVNTFEWDPANLRYREGTATWNADTSYTDFEEADIAGAPAEVMDRIDGLFTFSPTLAAGAAARLLPYLTVTGDVRHSLEENLVVGARSHLGVGAELTILPFLPLRAGVAAITGGYRLSGGLGLRLGPVQLAASGAFRETDYGADGSVAFGLQFGL